jgi:hypothetical protein
VNTWGDRLYRRGVFTTDLMLKLSERPIVAYWELRPRSRRPPLEYDE